MKGARGRRREHRLLMARITQVLGPLPIRPWRMKAHHRGLVVFVLLGLLLSILGPVAFAVDTPPDTTTTTSPTPTDTPAPPRPQSQPRSNGFTGPRTDRHTELHSLRHSRSLAHRYGERASDRHPFSN
jgi:hypothetical protein